MLSTEQLIAALKEVKLDDLSARCGLTRRHLERIRGGENSPSLKSAEAIVNALREMPGSPLAGTTRRQQKVGRPKASGGTKAGAGHDAVEASNTDLEGAAAQVSA